MATRQQGLKNPNCKQLVQDHAMMSSKDVELVARQLSRKSLKLLSLVNCHFVDGYDDVLALLRALGHNEQSRLQILSFRGVKVHSCHTQKRGIGWEALCEIPKLLSTKNKILSLDLSRNNLRCAGAIELAKGLRRNTTLEFLCIGHNRISDDGVCAIADAVIANKKSNLTTLKFDWNAIGERGAKGIAKMLKHNSSVQILNLDYNPNMPAAEIVRVLDKNSHLRGVRMRHTRMDREGVEACAAALNRNTPLTTLFVGGNDVGNDGCKILMEAMEYNTILRELELSNNNIQEDGVRTVVNYTLKNKNLKILHFSRNWCEQPRVEETRKRKRWLQTRCMLLSALRQNQTLLKLSISYLECDDTISGYFRRNWKIGQKREFDAVQKTVKDLFRTHFPPELARLVTTFNWTRINTRLNS